MSREVIADRAIWTGKKHYIMNVMDNEGVRYAEPKLKIMGISAVKSSTSGICRDALKESFRIIMRGTEKELKKHVNDFEKKFKSSEPEDISSPRGINEVEKFVEHSKMAAKPYKKGTHIHTRGAILYNNMIKELGLE